MGNDVTHQGGNSDPERAFEDRAPDSEPSAAASGLGVAGDSPSTRPVALPETVQGDSAQSCPCVPDESGVKSDVVCLEHPTQDIIVCRDCSEPAEFVTFSDPPLAKCFRCALLKAMERLCALCGKHPTECIVRAIGENERQDVIGICANCFSKRLSGMRN